ncbi:MAG: Na+/H+ antiporter subunit D [Planctomycetes bacterium]|nr:Na+/H+ antiporter subunit D [Planctomycetota bacterium]NOG53548.1 Na+/H+ antiporter subunit D [Planctomycetota bacterium]
MTNHWIILFIIVPQVTGILSVLLMNKIRAQRFIGTLSFVFNTVFSIYLLLEVRAHGTIFVSQMSDWPAPFGISIVFDGLSGLLVAASSMVALGCYIHSFSLMHPMTQRRYFHPLIQLLMFGVNLSFLTGDLFNLFVSFEIMLMASYAMLTLGAERRQLTQAYKYILLNLIASTVFVIAAGLVYGLMGTLNMADLARIVAEKTAPGGEGLPAGFTAVSVMMLLVFGLKGAIFPLWFWLPDTYYTCPISIAAMFSGMLTKVGVYALARTFPLIFAHGAGHSMIMVIFAISAAFTMFLGVLGAVSNHEVRRILAIHVISQVGYMVFGIALMTPIALAGCLFYMIQHMVVKSALFLCCGIMERYAGTDDLYKMGGLLKRDRLLAVLFFVAAMSLVGLPPLSGFFGKLVIIQEGWHIHWWLSVLGLATGALTLLSMLKIWSYGFWNPPKGQHVVVPTGAPRPRMLKSGYFGVTLLVLTALFLGFGAQPVYDIAFQAGEQLTNPRAYISAVLQYDIDAPPHEQLAAAEHDAEVVDPMAVVADEREEATP